MIAHFTLSKTDHQPWIIQLFCKARVLNTNLNSSYNNSMDFTLLIPLVLGWFSGWLVNYLADVLPVNRKLYRPACPKCQTKYSWKDYLFFHNCVECGSKRSPRTLIVQTLLTVIPIFLWIFPNQILPFSLALILLDYLAVVFVIDLEYKVILHPVSLTGAVLGLGAGIFLRSQHSIVYGITSTLLGGLAGFGVMLVFYFAGILFVKQLSKRRGMPSDEVALGFGDVNLAGILGLVLGWQAIFVCLFFAVVGGGLVSLIIMLGMLAARKYKAFTAIPYAPFLILSALYFLFF
jgi:prepilin signal peptidase PulO-like enzyme (type II secretory pathway)